jgi:hypothetical protein
LRLPYSSSRVSQSRAPKLSSRIAWLEIAFVILFVAGTFLRPLRMIPDATLSGTSALFEELTGMTPDQYAQARNDVQAMIESELDRTQGREIDFSRFETGSSWDPVCIFGPQTGNGTATRVLGLAGWDLALYSKVAKSDEIDAFVFVDSKRGTVRYLAEIPRSEADFATLSGRCYGREIVAVPAAGQAH